MSQPGKRSLALMRCEPLHATLTVATCARRWKQAQDGETWPESLSVCERCAVGALNAGGSDE